jgi:hypothetical protein
MTPVKQALRLRVFVRNPSVTTNNTCKTNFDSPGIQQNRAKTEEEETGEQKNPRKPKNSQSVKLKLSNS